MKERIVSYNDHELGPVPVRVNATGIAFCWPVFFAVFVGLVLSGLALFFGILSHRANPSHPVIEEHK